MKIFIAGSREISVLDDYTLAKLDSICSKGYDVLIGDCYGVDALVYGQEMEKDEFLIAIGRVI